MNWSIGIDIGGTVFKAVAVQDDGAILASKSRPTGNRTDSVSEWVDCAGGLISDFEREMNSTVPATNDSFPLTMNVGGIRK